MSGSAASGARLLQTANASSLSYSNANANPNTSLVGLNQFSVSNSTFFDYHVGWSGNNAFQATSQNPNNQFTLGYVMMPTYGCNFSTPYLIVNLSVCTAQCPAGSYANTQTLTCDACPSGCSSCPGLTKCSSCFSGFYLRIDSFCYTTCLVGFVENNATSVCDACSFGCAYCSSPTLCTQCFLAFYLNTTTNACDGCSTGCGSCSNGTVCSSC